jgi:hypothetical protein
MKRHRKEELGEPLWDILRREERSGPVAAAVEYSLNRVGGINTRRLLKAWRVFSRSSGGASAGRS